MKRKYQEEMDKHILDIKNYGIFCNGLTNKEVDKYLRTRAKKTKYSKYSTEQLRKRFWKIAGPGNTMAVVECPECDEQIVLMYRHDVLRFADQMFLGIPTYWD